MTSPSPYSSEVVWPEHTERKTNTREMFLSTQALCRLVPSPCTVNVIEETEHEPEEKHVIVLLYKTSFSL